MSTEVILLYQDCNIHYYTLLVSSNFGATTDPVRNPFAPGAGSRPPELAGRESILEEAHVAVQRALIGKPSRSQMLLGLRGVGKTVLLSKIEELADEAGHVTSFIEAPEGRPLSELLLPKLHQILRKLSLSDQARAKAHRALLAQLKG